VCVHVFVCVSPGLPHSVVQSPQTGPRTASPASTCVCVCVYVRVCVCVCVCFRTAFPESTYQLISSICCYSVVTILLHRCYTVVTLLLHYCYTVGTLFSHCCYTVEMRAIRLMFDYLHHLYVRACVCVYSCVRISVCACVCAISVQEAFISFLTWCNLPLLRTCTAQTMCLCVLVCLCVCVCICVCVWVNVLVNV
jgi:hypothetical protein